jgi:hypothetical protein
MYPFFRYFQDKSSVIIKFWIVKTLGRLLSSRSKRFLFLQIFENFKKVKWRTFWESACDEFIHRLISSEELGQIWRYRECSVKSKAVVTPVFKRKLEQVKDDEHTRKTVILFEDKLIWIMKKNWVKCIFVLLHWPIHFNSDGNMSISFMLKTGFSKKSIVKLCMCKLCYELVLHTLELYVIHSL